MSLGSRIRKLRTNKKMTQEELGKVLGVSKVSVSGYENDTRQPDNAALVKIAEYFGVSTDYLLGNKSGHGKSPSWANEKDMHDLKAFLDANEDAMTYEGEHLTDEERKQLRVAEATIFWRHRKQERK